MTSSNLEKSISDVWKDIENWYQDKSPRLFNYLGPGVTDQKLEKFESKLQISLPSDYKLSLKRHDGGSLIHNYWYLSIKEVEKRWEKLTANIDVATTDQQPTSSMMEIFQNKGWHPLWVPIAEHVGGVMICIDLLPTSKGLLEVEFQEGPRSTQISSFFEWLKSFRDDLREGIYSVNDAGYLVAK